MGKPQRKYDPKDQDQDQDQKQDQAQAQANLQAQLQGQGQGQPLLLPGGQRRRDRVQMGAQPEAVQRLVDAGRVRVLAVCAADQLGVLAGGQAGV